MSKTIDNLPVSERAKKKYYEAIGALKSLAFIEKRQQLLKGKNVHNRNSKNLGK